MPAGTPRRVDLRERLSLFSEHWSPKIVARLNDYPVNVVKVKGEFVWHSHRRPTCRTPRPDRVS